MKATRLLSEPAYKRAVPTFDQHGKFSGKINQADMGLFHPGCFVQTEEQTGSARHLTNKGFSGKETRPTWGFFISAVFSD